MRIKEEVKVIEHKVKTYIAEDGKEFQHEYECRRYEEVLKMASKVLEVEKLRIPELDDSLPLSTDGVTDCNNSFRWYALKSEDDFETLKSTMRGCYLDAPTSYPEVVCVEFLHGYDPYDGDCWGTTLSNCKAQSEEFWGAMGYKVTLEKM